MNQKTSISNKRAVVAAGKRSEPIALLRKLIAVESIFPHEKKIAEFSASYLSGCGFDVKLQKFAQDRYNVVAQKGPRNGALLLSAHLDTVPPYNYSDRNPFKMVEDGDKLSGLGVWDMKAGIALILRCASKCVPTTRGIRIVLTADEENISEGTWFAHRKGEFDGCSLAISHEISDAPEGQGGRPPIILGRRGRVVYRFTVSGVGAHGAGREGKSAIDAGMQMVRLLESLLMPAERTGPCRLFVRKFSSESASLSVPVEAVIEADVHYVPPYDEKSFLSYLRNDLDALALPEGCSWKVEIPVRKTPYIPPYATSENDGAVRKFLQSYGQRIGNYAISYGMSVADENIIAASGVPIVTVGPRGGGAHSNGEWISKSDYLLLAEKMPEIVQDFVDKRS